MLAVLKAAGLPLLVTFVIASTLTAYPAQRIVNTVGREMPADAAPLERQNYRFLLQEPTTLDISIAVYQAGGAVFSFEGLTRLDHNNELTPAAADSWEVSDDGLRWTFHLRRGAMWSDGRPVTAHDFVYTYVRILDPSSGNVNASLYYDIKGARPFNQGYIKDPSLLGLEAPDDYTFVVETDRPCPYVPLRPSPHPDRYRNGRSRSSVQSGQKRRTVSVIPPSDWTHGFTVPALNSYSIHCTMGHTKDTWSESQVSSPIPT